MKENGAINVLVDPVREYHVSNCLFLLTADGRSDVLSKVCHLPSDRRRRREGFRRGGQGESRHRTIERARV